jgi:hypothetical protein
MDLLLKKPPSQENSDKLKHLFEEYKNLRQKIITEYGPALWASILRNEIKTNQFPFNLRQ